jgi:molybdopterin-guanine dinucleotide biosynthesis protein A
MSECAGIILAGGEGRRFGGQDKAQLKLCGQALIDLTLARLRHQIDRVAVSVRYPVRWSDGLSAPVIEDAVPGAGPLAGLAAGLRWAAGLVPAPMWLITVPVDVPFFPGDLAVRLTQSGADAAVARSGTGLHYTVAAWRLSISDRIENALASDTRAIKDLLTVVKTADVEWPLQPVDPFLNINTPTDLEQAERFAASLMSVDQQR